MRPIVEPRALEVAVLQRKAEPAHKMQLHGKARAQARHIARIGRDLRLKQDYAHARSGTGFSVFFAAMLTRKAAPCSVDDGKRGNAPTLGRITAEEKVSYMQPAPRACPRFLMTCGVSTVLAVLMLVSGGRYAPLPRLGCDRLPSVMAGALAVGSVVAAPLRHTGKQRQRHSFASLHTASGTAASASPRLPHPPIASAILPPPRPDTAAARHLRGMLPHSQAPPRDFRSIP